MWASAIYRVSCYTASPVETCDRCGQGIKYVCLVHFKDGSVQRFGMDCIDRILSGDTSLKTLFRKNQKLLARYSDYVAILTRAEHEMPRGSEYYGSGLYFIADSEGKDISFDHAGLFHPIYDAERNAAARHYNVTDPIKRLSENRQDIAVMIGKLRPEVKRLESFLARIIAKGKI